MITTTLETATSCQGGAGGIAVVTEETLTYAAATDAVEKVEAQEVEIEVDEVKMEAEDHLAREYVQEFVLDHLDPADVKREVLPFSLSSSVFFFFSLPILSFLIENSFRRTF